jgi:hypothetical protein
MLSAYTGQCFNAAAPTCTAGQQAQKQQHIFDVMLAAFLLALLLAAL